MTETENSSPPAASVEEIQKGWHDLSSRVDQLETERTCLEQENKALRFLLERVIEHRQKSHGELVLLITELVSKLPLTDVGVLVSRLVEHNTNVKEVCSGLTKGSADVTIPQPSILKALEKSKRDLTQAIKPEVEELIRLDSPIETELLKSLIADPEAFFSLAMVRANRCFIKGQVPRERVVREFGEGALIFFNDLTTDPKRNPNPKPEEIVLTFKDDFETLFQQNPNAVPEKRQELMALYQRVQRSKADTEEARAQKDALLRLSFHLELLHYYENQATEAPDVIFAQRLPALIEQLVLAHTQSALDENLIAGAERLLDHIANNDHRLMVINNVGKSGGIAKTLKYVLRLRAEKLTDQNEIVPAFVKHMVLSSPQKTPAAQRITAILKLINPEFRKFVLRALMSTDRMRKDDAETLGRAVAKELGIASREVEPKMPAASAGESESQIAWERIKDLIARRSDSGEIAAAIRDRLHAHYDADEIKKSWVALIEAEPILFIRTFSQLPYLPDGKTDQIARAVMESYVTRLTHEKYATTYTKVLNSLRNMHKANPHSPTLQNFVALVKWVDPEAANKVSADIGMEVAA